MDIKLTGAGRTDQGKRRTNNEDAFLADDAVGLYAVCDGVGGKSSGEHASRRGVEALRAAVLAERQAIAALERDPTDRAPAHISALMERLVQRACAAVHHETKVDPRHGGSTTLDCVLRVGRRVGIGHVGDGRVYLIRGGQTYRMTEDHTILAEQIKAGLMTEEQASQSTMKGVLTRSLGSHASVQVDRLVLDVVPGDQLILCTDGLHGYLRDEQLAPLIAGRAPYDVPPALVQYANDQGGKDNVTVVTVACLSGVIDSQTMLARARLEALQATPLMKTLAYKEQVAVLSIATSVAARPGQIVVREGEAGREMFVVVRGRVAVSKAGARVAEVGPGGLVGEMALVDYGPRSATVTALEEADLLAFTPEAMIGLMRSDPSLGMKILWSMLQGVSAKLRASTEGLAGPR
jgi:serine/threonine protein phosphatase PrpC